MAEKAGVAGEQVVSDSRETDQPDCSRTAPRLSCPFAAWEAEAWISGPKLIESTHIEQVSPQHAEAVGMQITARSPHGYAGGEWGTLRRLTSSQKPEHR
jgi:hypothetical protein